jgi:hypothetical protein
MRLQIAVFLRITKYPDIIAAMPQIGLVLTLEDLNALASGQGILFTGASGLEIAVTCDSDTVGVFKNTINLALLQHLPPAPGTH